MQPKMPDTTELQDLPDKIESEIKSATTNAKNDILCNFVAINDWVRKTRKPIEWIRLFDSIHDTGFNVSWEGEGDDFKMYMEHSTGDRSIISIRYYKFKPVFSILAMERDGIDYRYYFDADDAFIPMGGRLVLVSEAKKVCSDEIEHLETAIKDLKNSKSSMKDLKDNKVGVFVKMKAMANLTKKLKSDKKVMADITTIERLSQDEYPRGTLSDHRAIDLLEKALTFLTKTIPKHVQDVIDGRKRELARLRELAGKETSHVPMPTMDDIVKQNDENFKEWEHPEKL